MSRRSTSQTGNTLLQSSMHPSGAIDFLQNTQPQMGAPYYAPHAAPLAGPAYMPGSYASDYPAYPMGASYPTSHMGASYPAPYAGAYPASLPLDTGFIEEGPPAFLQSQGVRYVPDNAVKAALTVAVPETLKRAPLAAVQEMPSSRALKARVDSHVQAFLQSQAEENAYTNETATRRLRALRDEMVISGDRAKRMMGERARMDAAAVNRSRMDTARLNADARELNVNARAQSATLRSRPVASRAPARLEADARSRGLCTPSRPARSIGMAYPGDSLSYDW